MIGIWGLSGQVEVVAQQRGGIWVHGLNANNAQWRKWEDLFTDERQLDSRNRLFVPDPNSPSGASWQDYHTEQGVNQMTNNVLADATVNGGGDARTIYFGFSMGGVVGREIDVNRQRNFGGIITSGSPLDGARIANSVRNGEAFNAIADGADVVLRGPLRQIGPTAYVFEVAGLAVTQLVRGFESVFNIFGLQQTNNQGTTDLMEGSGYMNSGIRDSQTNTPKVLIYGNENAPGCWRILSQAIGNGDDEQYVSVAFAAGYVYEAAMWVNFGIAAYYGIAAFFTFGATAWLAAYYAYVAIGWMEGMNFWRSDADRNWNYLIGASIPSYQTVCYEQLNPAAYADCLLFSTETPDDYERCYLSSMEQYCYNYYAQVNAQSDAFIKAASQSGFNSAWANNAVRIEAQGVNHLEMNRHPTMGFIYDNIFNGTAGASEFFITPR